MGLSPAQLNQLMVQRMLMAQQGAPPQALNGAASPGHGLSTSAGGGLSPQPPPAHPPQQLSPTHTS